MIRDRMAERIQSTATQKDLRAALDGLDLQAIPPHLRETAIKARLMAVCAETVKDPAERAKPAFQELMMTRLIARGKL